MLNAEKYKDELIKMANETEIIQVNFRGDIVPSPFQADRTLCPDRATSWFVKWLYEECTFKLSTLEHELLKHFYRDGYKYIARDKDNGLYLYKSSPIKDVNMWIINFDKSSDFTSLENFRNLFSSVRWEDTQATPIQDILNNCEVVDYD